MADVIDGHERVAANWSNVWHIAPQLGSLTLCGRTIRPTRACLRTEQICKRCKHEAQLAKVGDWPVNG